MKVGEIMDGLRFDLDWRNTELQHQMVANLGSQLKELELTKGDLEKHLVRKTIPIDFKLKLATAISMVDKAIRLNLQVKAILLDDTGIINKQDVFVYTSYHQTMAELVLKLYHIECALEWIL